MAGVHEGYGLALTAFGEPADLWQTVAQLLGEGISVEQMCLVALSTLMPRFAPKSGKSSSQAEHMARLHASVQTWTDGATTQQIVATSGPLLPVVREWQANDAEQARTVRSGIGPKTNLESLVAEGQVALIVRAADTSQQIRITRALLEISKQRVLSIMLRAPQPARGGPVA